MSNQPTYTVSNYAFLMRLIFGILFTIGTFGFFLPFLIAMIVGTVTVKVWVDDNGVSCKSGWLFRKYRHIPFGRINNVVLSTTPLGDWCGYAHIEFYTGNDRETIRLRSIDNAAELKMVVEQQTGARR
ncbi:MULTISPECIES: PH domain-containing protein [unclassified Streptomyces]|uniref:PH domain-containing protein n=1 Tax=unclassified Streptomyces TaxID=2593676 RepID=UPI00081F5C11|nr:MULTISPECIES: PH domain-containing protein [unclassified Streptomyces]MYZ34971.1 PH domain-containing protein [Streptomyces sp. SID4917]SCF71841.1 PH domain-containing protein [Streptomyces sp. MnatMP-M17]